jgi:hypothetical protein
VSGQQNNLRASGWKSFLGPLGRIVLAAVLVIGAVAAVQVVVKMLKGVFSLGGALPALYYLAYLLASVLVCYFVYRAYVRLVERRPLSELSGARAPRGCYELYPEHDSIWSWLLEKHTPVTFPMKSGRSWPHTSR